MPETKKKNLKKKKRKQRMIRRICICVAVVLLVGIIGLILADKTEKTGADISRTTQPVHTEQTGETAETSETETMAMEATATEAPAAAQPAEEEAVQPTLEAQVTPKPDEEIPFAIYIPIAGTQNRRIVNGFSSQWAAGRDIDCFEVLLSEEKEEHGARFYEIFDRLWAQYPEAEGRRIGYELQLTMADGSVKTYRILKPADTEGELFGYVECYLYDDIHQNGAWNYYHLLPNTMKASTAITSIKLHGGKQIAQVAEMQLTAFLYRDMADFDEEGRYTGPNFWTIGIHNK